MEEQENNLDKEELKQETTNAVNQFKDTMKDMNFKNETANATNFVKDMFNDPISKTKEIANSNENKYLKTSIFMLLVWVAARVLHSVLSLSKYATFGKNVLSVVKSALSPICIVLCLTAIVFILNKKHKKSLLSIFSTVTTVYVPMVMASIVNLLNLIDTGMYKITNAFTMIATFITVILSYFAFKDIFEEETELGALKKFILVELIYVGIAIVVSFMGIGMYL